MKLKKLLEYGGETFAATSPSDEGYFERRAAKMLSLLLHGKSLHPCKLNLFIVLQQVISIPLVDIDHRQILR